MRTFLVYLCLELKKTLKSIPYFLAGAIVLAALAGTIAFSASKMLYGERSVGAIQVGVVLPEEDLLSKKVVEMVASLDSVGSLCQFTYLDKSEGERLLRSGELSALMELPEGLIEGIMDGTNLPVTVILPERSGVEASVFRELTEAATSMLGTSQAGIYAADDYLRLHRMETSIAQAERDLNGIFLRYALTRGNNFSTEKVSAAGDVSTAVFYAISAAVLILLLLGIPAAPIVRPYTRVMEQKLALSGIGPFKRTAVRMACLFLLLLLAASGPVVYGCLKGYIPLKPAALLMGLLVCLAVSGWTLLLYELCQNTVAAILLIFSSTAVMMFFSGGIIPAVFLPRAVRVAGQWMPSAFLTDGIRYMLTGEGSSPVLKLILLTGAAFLLSSAVRRNHE